MAIGQLFNTLTFGGVNSGDYDIYISGEGVFNAPVRAVEMISVPGRNGDISLDLGRFENIIVEYPAGVFGGDKVDFREKISAFRNAILSQRGYQRLTDTYHPDEFRLGLYSAGLEIEPVHYNEAGEFTLVFNCKPQRFLVEGENPIQVTSGQPITNPTLMNSSPLVEVFGYGDLTLNGYVIDFSPDYMGNVILWDYLEPEDREWGTITGGASYTATFDENYCLPGDVLTIKYWPSTASVGRMNTMASVLFRGIDTAVPQGSVRNATATNVSAGARADAQDNVCFVEYQENKTFTFGTPGQTEISALYGVDVYSAGTFFERLELTLYFKIEYDGGNAFTFSSRAEVVNDPMGIVPNLELGAYFYVTDLHVDSHVSSLGNPTYIDCDLGEAYKIENGERISLNRFIDLGSYLPVLSPGENEITFDNTITDVEIIPRWWKL